MSETCDTCVSYSRANELNGVGQCLEHKCPTHWQHSCADYCSNNFIQLQPLEGQQSSFAFLYGMRSELRERVAPNNALSNFHEKFQEAESFLKHVRTSKQQDTVSDD